MNRDRILNQRSFVKYLVDNMTIDELKSYARENLHIMFNDESDFDFNETMLDNDFDPREVQIDIREIR